ncbi:hypothetical protein ES703_116032 [subsurface metagenome]
MSVTVPSISTLLPCTETFGDAVAVVALGPLPIAYTRWSYVSIVAIMLSPIIALPPQTVPRKAPLILHISVPSVALMHMKGAPRGMGSIGECSEWAR